MFKDSLREGLMARTDSSEASMCCRKGVPSDLLLL